MTRQRSRTGWPRFRKRIVKLSRSMPHLGVVISCNGAMMGCRALAAAFGLERFPGPPQPGAKLNKCVCRFRERRKEKMLTMEREVCS